MCVLKFYFLLGRYLPPLKCFGEKVIGLEEYL